jgi:indolepyruvate ferredoxin oxidoreductase
VEAKAHLASHDIVFQPGINEDLAATAVWGSQQVPCPPRPAYQGVFAMWYGKGPGVDRTGDVFRHANAAGSSQYGGVLVIAGDDHAAKSSTLPHQTDHFFKSMMMPVLAPAGVQDYLDFGVHGWACRATPAAGWPSRPWPTRWRPRPRWTWIPCASTTKIPDDFALPADGLNLRWPDPPLVQEKRLLHAQALRRAGLLPRQRLNRIVIDSPQPRLGIITSGKSYLDVRQALDDLGIDDASPPKIGIRLYKVGMVWPLEAEGVRRFAEGLDEILVIEEKRQLLEYQLKEELYNWREDVRPRVVGKFDEKGEWSLLTTLGADGRTTDHGEWLLPAAGELTPAMIARVIAARIAASSPPSASPASRLPRRAKEAALASRVFAPIACPPSARAARTTPRPGPARLARAGRHRLPLHGHLAVARIDADLLPDGG